MAPRLPPCSAITAALALAVTLAAGGARGETGYAPAGTVTPTGAPPTFADMKGAVRSVVAGITTIPNGPPVPEPVAGDWAKTCDELYYERVGLYARTGSYTPAYYDDPRNHTIAFLGGMVATPLWYALGATAFESYYERQRVAAVERRMDALRQVSAQRDCYVRR